MKPVIAIMRINNCVLREAGGRAFKEKIAEYVNSINAENLNEISELSPSDAHNKFEEFVVSTAKELAEREVKIDLTGSHNLRKPSSITSTLETKPTKVI